MDVFVGQTRGGDALAQLVAAGIGEITQPSEYPPRRRPWLLDNGAYAAWRAGRRPDGERLACALRTAIASGDCPVGVVVPDLVAGGLDSLAFSLKWLDTYTSEFPDQRWYLAVQDGMVESDIEPLRGIAHGVFVGGSTEWKLATGGAWARWAAQQGLACHIGRCGTITRLRWARDVGATSCDSSLPLWSRRQLAAFLAAVRQHERQCSALAGDLADVGAASHGAAWLRTRKRPMPRMGRVAPALQAQLLLPDN